MKTGVGIAIGAAAGGGIGSFLTWLLLSRKFNREKEAELEEVRAYYRKKLKEKEGNEVKNVPKKTEKEPKPEDKHEKLSQKVGLAERNTVDIGRKKIDPVDIDYTKFSKISSEYRSSNGESMFKNPHEIDEDDFDHDPDYNKVILTWYENDDIMADENDHISDYKVEDFGYENLSEFGTDCVKYLRNEKTQTDFKIIYESTISYDEATGGINLNDP